MNAFSLLRNTEYIGAKELRIHLDKVLYSTHPYRIMHRNKPTVAILPDDQFMQLLEILEELKDSGYLEATAQRLRQEKKMKKNAWFWNDAWQEGEQKVDQEIHQRGLKKVSSYKALMQELKG